VKKRSVLVSILVVSVVAVLAASGLHRVPGSERWLRLDRSGQPAGEVGAGVHWWLGPGGGTLRFPAVPDTIVFPDPAQARTYRLFDAGANEITTRFAVVYSVEPGEAPAVARALSASRPPAARPSAARSSARLARDGGLADTLRARLARLGRPLAARFPGEALRSTGGRPLAAALAGAIRLDGLRISVTPLAGNGTATGVKVLIVGVDAADWRVADPLIRAGRMPNLASLIQRGVRADLHTLTPMLSPLLWTTIATGATPDRHGILDFLTTDPRTGDQVPVSSALRRVPAFWNILTQFEVSQGIVAWLATWPAEAVSGHLVTDRFGFLAFAGKAGDAGEKGMTWPPEYADHARTLEVTPGSLPVSFWKRFFTVPDPELAGLGQTGFRKGRLVENFALTIATALTSTAIGEDLRKTADPRVLAVYYELIDAAGHLVMPYAPPRRPQIPRGDFERYGRAMDATYELQDELLGRLLAGADTANTVVFVLSDHGMKSGDERPGGSAEIKGGEASRWHRDPGVLVMAGPGVRRGARLSGNATMLDFAPTLLTVLGLSVPRTMPGKVLTEAFDAEGASRYTPSYVDSLALRPEVWTAPAPTLAAQAGPGAAAAHLNLGLVMESEGRLAEAEAEYRRALQEAPQLASARNNLGSVLLKQRRVDDARAILEALHRDQPEYVPACINLGSLYEQTGRLPAADALYRSILTREPGNIKAQLALGQTLVREGRAGDAEPWFRRVLAENPDEPNAHFGLGLVAGARRDYLTAAAEFRRTLVLEPGHQAAAQNLRMIERAVGGR
jgi:Tfp pilus assembly protein PilF